MKGRRCWQSARLILLEFCSAWVVVAAGGAVTQDRRMMYEPEGSDGSWPNPAARRHVPGATDKGALARSDPNRHRMLPFRVTDTHRWPLLEGPRRCERSSDAPDNPRYPTGGDAQSGIPSTGGVFRVRPLILQNANLFFSFPSPRNAQRVQSADTKRLFPRSSHNNERAGAMEAQTQSRHKGMQRHHGAPDGRHNPAPDKVKRSEPAVRRKRSVPRLPAFLVATRTDALTRRPRARTEKLRAHSTTYLSRHTSPRLCDCWRRHGQSGARHKDPLSALECDLRCPSGVVERAQTQRV